jgi:hypothetical protein
MLQARERTPIPSPSAIFFFGLAAKSIKELGGASAYAILMTMALTKLKACALFSIDFWGFKFYIIIYKFQL